MTKKVFTAFAARIARDLAQTRASFPQQYAEAVRAAAYAAETFAAVAAEQNPRFDRDRFMEACGLRAAFAEMAERRSA